MGGVVTRRSVLNDYWGGGGMRAMHACGAVEAAGGTHEVAYSDPFRVLIMTEFFPIQSMVEETVNRQYKARGGRWGARGCQGLGNVACER